MEICANLYLSDQKGTGKEQLCRRLPRRAGSTQPSIARTRTGSDGKEHSGFLRQQNRETEAQPEAKPHGAI